MELEFYTSAFGKEIKIKAIEIPKEIACLLENTIKLHKIHHVLLYATNLWCGYSCKSQEDKIDDSGTYEKSNITALEYKNFIIDTKDKNYDVFQGYNKNKELTGFNIWLDNNRENVLVFDKEKKVVSKLSLKK